MEHAPRAREALAAVNHPALNPKPKRMHPALLETSHRPWPLPDRAWSWRQAWLNLGFIHYPVAAEVLAARLPRGLRLQTYDGVAWIGLVPFRLSAIARRHLPVFPWFSTFAELNVRTYVEAGGKPGVWFFSLDAASWPVVAGGRGLYDLPYFTADMTESMQDGWHHLRSRRGDGRAQFSGRYRPVGDVFQARPGSFEHWATERYCLYAHSPRRGLRRMEVHHRAWPLQRAEIELEESNLLEAAGLRAGGAPVAHFSAGVEVVSYDAEVVAP